jgi:hypothetical protein
MKLLFLSLCLLAFPAQTPDVWVTQKGTVHLYSDATLEDIEAWHRKPQVVYRSSDHKLIIKLPIIEFDFKNETMESHFNEHYMETVKYPNATFDGTLQVETGGASKAKGNLTIHGVTRPVEIIGTTQTTGGTMLLKGKCKVKTADYGIKIPELLFEKIAEEIEITFDFTLIPKS